MNWETQWFEKLFSKYAFLEKVIVWQTPKNKKNFFFKNRLSNKNKIRKEEPMRRLSDDMSHRFDVGDPGVY